MKRHFEYKKTMTMRRDVIKKNIAIVTLLPSPLMTPPLVRDVVRYFELSPIHNKVIFLSAYPSKLDQIAESDNANMTLKIGCTD